MSYRSFIIVQGSLSNNLYWIYALLSRNQPCRDYALWEALFGQNWWEGAQKHFRGPGAGRIFTLRLAGLKIGPNDAETQFFLFLAPTFVNVMLHDPDFFILNDNPYGLPTVTRVFDAATMYSHYHRIALTEIEELDLPTDPCNNDQSYNFNSCVRRSLARQVIE